METVRAAAVISGRVQGVWFRASTKEMADELGLKGFVRNLPLRRVEAVFEGPRDLVEQALAWCQQGPAQAEVSEVHVSWQDPTGEFDSFEIRY
ncbi:MAG: acylphosphatase [Deltaproteobacteria bacterium]|nr:acylphosphatase [Deltaproteobacteria bacterium]